MRSTILSDFLLRELQQNKKTLILDLLDFTSWGTVISNKLIIF